MPVVFGRQFSLRNIALLCTSFTLLLLFIQQSRESSSTLATLWRLENPSCDQRQSLSKEQTGGSKFDAMIPEIQYPDHAYAWIDKNQRGTHALFRCIERGDCAQNQTKVVILASDYFRLATEKGQETGGEVIYALSTIRALENMGYTALYASSMSVVVEFYHLFDTAVKIIIADPWQARDCFESATCLRSEAHPAGIPAWKIFSIHFWASPENPLGAKWTLSPEDYKTNTYLGYSVEAQCARFPFVPHAQRKRGQVYILAKLRKFFRMPDTAWPPEFYDAAVNEVGASFIAAAANLEDEPGLAPAVMSESIENISDDKSVLAPERFYELLRHSVALIGLGNPVLSPTPYDSLCLGIPFINVVNDWDRNNPTDRSKWWTQHNGLLEVSPPYVYHVYKGDREGFIRAIKDATANPIDSYVIPRMTMTALEHRVGKIVENDWRTEAAALLKARREGKEEGPLFWL